MVCPGSSPRFRLHVSVSNLYFQMTIIPSLADKMEIQKDQFTHIPPLYCQNSDFPFAGVLPGNAHTPQRSILCFTIGKYLHYKFKSILILLHT